MSSEQKRSDLANILVCGLGSLGQYCVSVLKEFGVTIYGIEFLDKTDWELPELPNWLDTLIIGDCRQSSILEQAYVGKCRAVLLVTQNAQVNIAAAFAARSLNPQIRIVMRSAQENLNQLLAQHLGNFVAFAPSQLSAAAFALAALGDETLGFFHLDNQLMRVVQLTIPADHRWCDLRQLHELNTSTRKLLSHYRPGDTVLNGFYQWEPNTKIQAGNVLIWVSLGNRLVASDPLPASDQNWLNFLKCLDWKNWRSQLNNLWQQRPQTQRVAIICGGLVAFLYLACVGLFKLQYPEIALQDAFNVALVLILGGFDNLFGQLKLPFPIPEWLHLFSAGMTIVGTIFIGILYAMLTERVLSAKFQFLQRRPPLPQANHIVLIGLGKIGKQVAMLLQSMKQPLIGINETDLEPGVLPKLPVVIGNIPDALARANLPRAKSVMVLTPDEVTNLELGLMARSINPSSRLVIRTDDPQFSENVTRLVPFAQGLSVYGLAAEAFAAAAFGENILHLFHVNRQTILVTEYQVNQGDSLDGQLLADIAYGYGVVPLLHQRGSSLSPEFLPPDDIRLHAGDRLVVMANLEGLQNVERGILAIRPWLVRIESAFSEAAIFEGATILTRCSGCDIPMARSLMNNLPATLQFPLYQHQAQRLVRELSKIRVQVYLVQTPVSGTVDSGSVFEN
ncbi:MAG: NAD-binding protein [Aphanocapsa sp. GSE-SYN-MK-11-07L]|jgi:Trk K+ transport system NAD-binding subunit|nr:NAD-binding protein [Aphanocapsa sp. GSE-SYN-MK-11-07L]